MTDRFRPHPATRPAFVAVAELQLVLVLSLVLAAIGRSLAGEDSGALAALALLWWLIALQTMSGGAAPQRNRAAPRTRRRTP